MVRQANEEEQRRGGKENEIVKFYTVFMNQWMKKRWGEEVDQKYPKEQNFHA